MGVFCLCVTLVCYPDITLRLELQLELVENQRPNPRQMEKENEQYHQNSLVVTGVLAALMAGNVALASDVPTEVTLIDKQTLVRNNGAEVQSEQDTDCRLRGSG